MRGIAAAIVIPELDYPDVSANSVVMAALKSVRQIGIGGAILHVIPERRLRRIRDLTKRFGS